MAVYAVGLSWLSLERHAAHLTNALDLGYYSNTLWNTLHGQPFRFTTYHQANFVFPEFDPNVARKQDDLLAYHVEPILLPLSLLYAIWPDPRILLIVQSLILASGAWPAYRIARRHNISSWVALVFPTIYLLSPSLISANLSDFHPVAFSAALFLWAFDALERGAFRTYFLFVGLLLMLKEEMGLEVAMLGLWAVAHGGTGLVDWLCNIRRSSPGAAQGKMAAMRAWLMSPTVRAGLLTILLAAAWTVIAILIQRDAAGRQLSFFASRYAWLGHNPKELLVNALTTRSIFDWLRQPGAYGYLGFMLAQTGFMALFAPEVLLLAGPETLINLFSSFDWMHSGLAHYSAPIVPFLVIATIVGTNRLAGWISALGARVRRFSNSRQPGIEFLTQHRFALGAMIALLGSGYHAFRAEQIPLPGATPPPAITAHDNRLALIVAKIPGGAPVSSQSDLYPHVPERANIYLFPTISDAEYILLDVTGQTYPIQPGEYAETIKRLLYESPAGLLAADDGYLLLARNEGQQMQLPHTFFSFARAGVRAPQHSMQVRFGQDLELVGYDVDFLSPRQVPAPAVNVRTYWRALRPLAENLRFVHRINAMDGFLQNAQYGSPTEQWYPTSRWALGEVIVVEQRGLQIPHSSALGIRVEYGDPATPIIVEPQPVEQAAIVAGVLRLKIE